jgi:hypothetical protein
MHAGLRCGCARDAPSTGGQPHAQQDFIETKRSNAGLTAKLPNLNFRFRCNRISFPAVWIAENNT